MVRISLLSCLLLVLLRIAIGWHFFFEGVYKYQLDQRGESEISKPFSSEAYFNEAEGPLGPLIRGQIGDPNRRLSALLALNSSAEDRPGAKMPIALAKEWDDYARQFTAYYKLNQNEIQDLTTKMDQAKSDFVLWRTNAVPPAKDKGSPKSTLDPKSAIVIEALGRTIIYRSDDPEGYPIPRRVAIFEEVAQLVKDTYQTELPLFHKDVEKTRLRGLKTKLASIRDDLHKELTAQTEKMKTLVSKVVGSRLAVVQFPPPEDAALDDDILEMITLAPGEGDSAERMPVKLAQEWDAYLEFVKAHGRDELRNNPNNADQILTDAKVRYVRYLLGRDPFLGTPNQDSDIAKKIDLYRAAVAQKHAFEKKATQQMSVEDAKELDKLKKEIGAYRTPFLAEIRLQSEVMARNLGGFATDKLKKKYDTYQGLIPEVSPSSRFLGINWPTSKLDWLNQSTRWGLLLGGGCLLLGLFTRLAGCGCFVFLAIEILSNSPFPWLPESPKSEGHYLFVNKNMIEALSLLVLITLPTGRWLGLDALLCRCWPFRKRARPEKEIKQLK